MRWIAALRDAAARTSWPACSPRLRLPIIYVTHDQEEALAVGDRVAVLRAGRLEAVMPPHELWHSPPNEFVARFLGLTNICSSPIVDGTERSPRGAAWSCRRRCPPALTAAHPTGGHRTRPGRTDRGPGRGVHLPGRPHQVLRLRAIGRDAPSLEMHVGQPAAPTVGQRLRLRVAPAGIMVLPEPAP